MVYPATYERVKRSNKAAEIVKEFGYDYINLERDWRKAGIDYNKDFYNYDHLNIYGTVKLTDYLGGIVQNKYGIKRHALSGAQKESWDKAAKTFGKLYRYCDEQAVPKRRAGTRRQRPLASCIVTVTNRSKRDTPRASARI